MLPRQGFLARLLFFSALALESDAVLDITID